jgi:hypothetical protein
MNKVTPYKGDFLHHGSRAYQLLQEGKFKELDQHLAQLHKEFLKRRGEL